MAGLPIGYVINQLWYLFYSEALDIHPAIFRFLAKKKWKQLGSAGRWRQGYISETVLALSHRLDDESSEGFLDWHRNRLATFHSNASIVTAIILAILTYFPLVAVKAADWASPHSFCHRLAFVGAAICQALNENVWLLSVLVLVAVSLVINARRAYKMIVLFNAARFRLHDLSAFEHTDAFLKHLFETPKPGTPRIVE